MPDGIEAALVARLGTAPYVDREPTGHSRVCWAGAIGYACRRGLHHELDAQEIIERARIAVLDGIKPCACRTRSRRGRTRARRS